MEKGPAPQVAILGLSHEASKFRVRGELQSGEVSQVFKHKHNVPHGGRTAGATDVCLRELQIPRIHPHLGGRLTRQISGINLKKRDTRPSYVMQVLKICLKRITWQLRCNPNTSDQRSV